MVLEGEKSSVTRTPNTLKVSNKERDAAKSRKNVERDERGGGEGGGGKLYSKKGYVTRDAISANIIRTKLPMRRQKFNILFVELKIKLKPENGLYAKTAPDHICFGFLCSAFDFLSRSCEDPFDRSLGFNAVLSFLVDVRAVFSESPRERFALY